MYKRQVLNCANTNVADLTGVREYLPGLTGLNLTGTKMTKVTSSMLPSGLKTLDLTNCKDLTYVELEGHPNQMCIRDRGPGDRPGRRASAGAGTPAEPHCCGCSHPGQPQPEP